MSPHIEPPDGAGEFHERTRMSPQMTMSPWFPWLFVRLLHSSQLMISRGLAGDEMSMSRQS
jgi:hypothetical protein